MKTKTRLFSRNNLQSLWNKDIDSLLSSIEKAFVFYQEGDVILPEKTSQIFDQISQNRINCMPATVKPLGIAGVKWVSVFPNNPKNYGLSNVGGLMVLSEVETGLPIAVMDAGFLTALRTAAVDVLASRYLAPKNPKVISLIGTGEQARFHAELLALAFPDIDEIRVSGRTLSHSAKLSKELVDSGINAVDYGDRMMDAVLGADILVTAISGQAPVLKADWINQNTLYCHVGGWEDEYAVPLKADKIICDSWSALKHRGSPTIAKMYQEGLLEDSNIYCNLGDLVCGIKPAREGKEFIYFNAIGLAFVDVVVADWLLRHSVESDNLAVFDFCH